VTNLDTSEAEAVFRVVCTLTGAEKANQTESLIEIGPDPFARIKDIRWRLPNALSGRTGAAVVC